MSKKTKMSGGREDRQAREGMAEHPNDPVKGENSQDFAVRSRQVSAQEFRRKGVCDIGQCAVKFEERLIICQMKGDVLSLNIIGEQDCSQELVRMEEVLPEKEN